MHNKSRLSLAIALALAGISNAGAEQVMGEVTVTATRTSAPTDAVPATVTAIDAQTIQRRLPADEADLFRDEPDVSFARDLRRFGATRVNIRGIDDNRVSQLVDGVRMPDFYNSGGPTNFTMSTPLGVSTDFLRRVEILRGPASSLYGSDAIGGVVGYLTLDPSDLLEEGKAAGGRYRIGYNGANRGLTNTLLGAWQGDGVQALLGYSQTRAEEFRNQGRDGAVSTSRTRPNPQDVDDRGILAKLLMRPAQGHKLGLVLEGREQEADVSVRRLAASLPRVTAMEGEDNGRRVRASLEWEHMPAGAFYDRLTARIYHQEADTRNDNLQTRTNTSATCSASSGSGTNCLIDQAFRLSQTATGLSAQFESALKGMGADHLLTYGVDLSRVKTDEKRDATVYNLRTGAVGKTLAGDTFPLRDFAVGHTDTAGLFVQDEISGLAGGRLSLIPGLRYDWRRLSPRVDALARNVLAAIGREAVETTESAFSPKLAALWRASDAYSLYGQIARGFRAPNYDEVNGAFRNAVQGYGTSPNPDLRPETSVGVELGVRLHLPTVRGQFAVYDNRYRNFIESVALACPSDPSCIAGLRSTYQYVNRARARIYGADARAAWDFMPGWRLDGAVAYAHGQNESTDEPLNSVEPLRASIGLARDAGTWGAEARLRAAASVKRTDDSDGEWFRPGGYGVTDIGVWWRPARGVQVSLALNNLFDKKYWLWGDIRQADARSPLGVDFYSQPGRTLSASLSYQF
ncbi:TonB-dependent hemoglobin/transferrin/lactoferrin family receptor [Noviherbaspirillum aridicola]|uniref:Sugar transporter n=1 Tax=Noviherbaspirillum aridicola TaxID=2849687 RepID=A0ABQ4Q996_9BURK|nr:TonB-dependent hemoglobin/transferrin/lactoferrin family receptor [Noviherbaspirillum aridicola]GIZ53621.1 sugar transporter [Noviherbaspirillum aridicola]